MHLRGFPVWGIIYIRTRRNTINKLTQRPRMQTENSFIAQQCDQAGEVCELVSDLRPDPYAIPVPVQGPSTIDFLPIPLVQGKWVQQRDFTLKDMQDYAQAHVDADRAQRQAVQEPVLIQCRMAPNWDGDKRYWGTWEECSAESADNYERITPYNDWHYEVRRLYPAPMDAEITALKEQLRTDAANIKNMRREIRYLLEQSTQHADSTRLTWLEHQALETVSFGYVVDAPHDGEYAVYVDNKAFYGQTLRMAIDQVAKTSQEITTSRS